MTFSNESHHVMKESHSNEHRFINASKKNMAMKSKQVQGKNFMGEVIKKDCKSKNAKDSE